MTVEQIVATANAIELIRAFSERPLHFRVTLPEQQSFLVMTCPLDDIDYVDRLKITIIPVIPTCRFKATVVGRSSSSVVLDNDYPTRDYPTKVCSRLTITFEHIPNRQKFTCPLGEDLMEFINSGPNVTLAGDDGTNTVQLRLLKMRANVFKAMFSGNTLEKKTMTIQLPDFDTITLGAFGQYLMTGEIKNGVDTALGLTVLGDKYDIQTMKESSEKFVLDNLKEFELDKVLDIFYKLSPNVLMEAFEYCYQRPEEPPLVTILNFHSLSDKLVTFFSFGPMVTLVGNDGSTTVSLRLLEMRAEAFVDIFNNDTLEKQTMAIQLQDFDTITLDAFGHYLLTGEIKNGSYTALGLMVLGDKYDIQPMKESAECYVLNNFDKFKSVQIVDTFHKISPKVLTEALKKRYYH